MTPTLGTLVVVEDHDDSFQRILASLGSLKYPIERASNYRDAKVLHRDTYGKVFWIVDGIFPLTSWKRPEELGLDLIEYLERRSPERGNKVGFTSEVKIFEGSPIPVYTKEYFESSLDAIRVHILSYLDPQSDR